MSKWILWCLGALIVASVIFVFFFGLKPKAVGVINPSEFRSPEAFGEVLLLRLSAPLLLSDLIIAGIDKDEQLNRALISFFVNSKGLIPQKRICYFTDMIETVNLISDQIFAREVRQLEDPLTALAGPNPCQILFVANPQAFVRQKESIAHKIAELNRAKVLSLSTGPLFLSQKEAQKSLACPNSPQNYSLDCALIDAPMGFRKKKRESTNLWRGAAVRHGESDYLLLLRKPDLN